MNKTTQGPWDYRRDVSRAFEILSEEGTVLRLRSGLMPTEHDARLMAAAPELLSACKFALTSLEAAYEVTGGLYSEAIADLRASITKAEGNDNE